jgi:hypothetical protein
MLGVPATWELAVDYEDSTGVLDKAALVDAVNAGADRVNLRDIQTGEKTQREKLNERIKEGSPADKLATPYASAAAAVPVLLSGYGLLGDSEKVKNETFLLVAVVCFAAALIVTLIPQFWRKSITVKPARLDLVKKQARTSGLKTFVALATLALVVAGLGFGIASIAYGGKSSAQNADIGTPIGTQTATGIDVTLIVKWTNLGTTVAKVRTTVVTLPDRDLVYRQAPRRTSGSSDITQEVKFTLQAPAMIETTTEALDANDKTVGETESREDSLP